MRAVIPIVGPELLEVDTDRGPRLLYDWVAENLARKLGIDTRALPQPYTLNDVVCWFLAARGRREEAYARVRGILRDAAFAPPAALRQLARLFLRMTKRHRLSDPRDVGEVLADDHSVGDTRLMGFLQQVNVRTRVFSGGQSSSTDSTSAGRRGTEAAT